MTGKAAFLLCCLLASPAPAAEIHLTMPNRLEARAYFQEGRPGKPAVLVLHGFLQTYNFHTVHSIVDGLSEAGYTVLAPTLTLGVPFRDQSLSCEAIHTQTIESDETEIETWLAWLEKQQPGPVILIGHSTGSLELLAYIASHHDPHIRKLIGVSMIEAEFRASASELDTLASQLKKRIQSGDHSLITRQYSFCEHYSAPPEGMYSFLTWTPARILDTASGIRIPVTFIMGSDDNRISAGWIDRLRRTGKKVHVIEGAGHFLDGLHEFDLTGAIDEEVKS